MKRSATTDTTNDANHDHKKGRRQTRAMSRRIQDEVAFQQAEAHRMKQGSERAARLSATPLLQALPWVLKSGFLYQHEILTATSLSRNWTEIWSDVKDELPENCQVEVLVDAKHRGRVSWPLWVQARGLEDVIPSQAFARQVFDKVIDLKVAAKKTKGQQKKAREALPKWGVDFMAIKFMVWGPTNRNDGGMAINLQAFSPNYSINSYVASIPNFLIRLDPDLCLWTGIRTWKVYDGKPLWDWEFVRSPVFDDYFDDYFRDVYYHEDDGDD
jgi:hypothetical protein